MLAELALHCAYHHNITLSVYLRPSVRLSVRFGLVPPFRINPELARFLNGRVDGSHSPNS